MADVFPAKRPEPRGGRENSLVCRLGEERGGTSKWTVMLPQHSNCIIYRNKVSLAKKTHVLTVLSFTFNHFPDGVTYAISY